MTVFITIPWFYPAYKAGGPIQSVANLVNRFGEGIEYRIFCGCTDLNELPLTGINTGVWTRYNANTLVWYAAKENISSTLTDQAELIKPDIIFIIGLFSWYYNIVPLLFCKAPKKILSVRGMLHPGALSQKKWKKKIFLNILKMSGRQRRVIFHATDEAEKRYTRDVFGKGIRVAAAGNFPSLLNAVPAPVKIAGTVNLVSVALISPMKNHLTVLQALAGCTSTIRWNIFGPVKDMEYWQACLDKIQTLPQHITVTFHGELPPPAKAVAYRDNHVFILPSKSENFGHAFTEAFSAGRPVITSKHTPWNNLAAVTAGVNSEISTEAISTAVEFFAAMDEPEYQRYCAGAVKYISSQIDEAGIKAQYREMFSA